MRVTIMVGGRGKSSGAGLTIMTSRQGIPSSQEAVPGVSADDARSRVQPQRGEGDGVPGDVLRVGP